MAAEGLFKDIAFMARKPGGKIRMGKNNPQRIVLLPEGQAFEPGFRFPRAVLVQYVPQFIFQHDVAPSASVRRPVDKFPDRAPVGAGKVLSLFSSVYENKVSMYHKNFAETSLARRPAGQTHLNFESFKKEVVIQGYFEAFTLQARLPGDTSQ